GRLGALAGLVIAASIGAAIALFATGKLPSELNTMLGLGGDKTAAVSRPASDALKTPEQLSSPATRPPAASTDPRPIGEDTARAAVVRDASERAPTIRGVTDNEIRFGISAAFTGSAKELGNQMKLGIQTAFNLINDAGGIHGRELRIVATDDGDEPERTAGTQKETYEKEKGIRVGVRHGWQRWHPHGGGWAALRSRAQDVVFRGVHRRRPAPARSPRSLRLQLSGQLCRGDGCGGALPCEDAGFAARADRCVRPAGCVRRLRLRWRSQGHACAPWRQ